MPRVDGDVTKQQIKEVALDLFTTKGYSATSLREIAERMNFTKAALYYHFATKDAMLEWMLEPLLEAHEKLLDASPESLSNIEEQRDYLSAHLDVVMGHRNLAAMFTSDPAVFTNETVGPRVQAMLGRIINLLSGGGSGVETVRAMATLQTLGTAVHPLPGSDAEVHATLLGAALAILQSEAAHVPVSG